MDGQTEAKTQHQQRVRTYVEDERGQLFLFLGGEEGRRRDGSHTTGVGPVVTIKGTLVILSRWHDSNRLSVAETQQ
jgi:hypothetical protein